MYSFMGGGLFCAGVGNILLIVSTATDYWMQYRHSNNYMHQGLWRYCMPGKCFTHTDSIGEVSTPLQCITKPRQLDIHFSSFATGKMKITSNAHLNVCCVASIAKRTKNAEPLAYIILDFL